MTDFDSSKTDFQLFTDPFSVDVAAAAEGLQLELITVQNSSMFHTKHREGSILDFYKPFDRNSFPGLRDHAEQHISLFGNTYICEQIFSVMNKDKSETRSRLTNRNLQ